jgi:hypothetical protein
MDNAHVWQINAGIDRGNQQEAFNRFDRLAPAGGGARQFGKLHQMLRRFKTEL